MTAITIGSLEGGGGVELGHLTAERLGYDYVDRLILAEAARSAGTTVAALHERESRVAPTMRERIGRFLTRLFEQPAWSEAGMEMYYGTGSLPFLTEEYERLPQPRIRGDHLPEDQKYLDAITRVMRDLAERGNVVIVGRGGSHILRGNPRVLRVGVVADYEDRVARVMRRSSSSREAAEKLIAERDRARAYYFKRLLDVSNSMTPELFHLTINSSDVNLEYATDMVVDACHALEAGRLRK